MFSHGKLYVAVLKSHFKRWIEDINNRDEEDEYINVTSNVIYKEVFRNV